VAFGQKVPKLNSRPVYCSRLYGMYLIEKVKIRELRREACMWCPIKTSG
jgi:hypothetical protein